MRAFLDLLAQEILQEQSPKDFTIILPNKRAGIFLSKALVNIAGKPIISPDIIDINEFINRLSPWENIEGLELIFEFYQTYKAFYSEQKNFEVKSFDEFIKWGPIILRDFDEIDKFLLNPVSVFNYLSEAKALEQWNLENSTSEFIKEYKAYFSSLAGLHQMLNKNLATKKLAYNGMKYRYVADNIAEISKQIHTPVIFAGFNALTKAEEKIFTYLLQHHSAKIFWDADEYYMRAGFEAGNSMRENKKKFHGFQWIGKYFEQPKNIEIIEVSGKTAQMEVVAELLYQKNKTHPDTDWTQTAVVLNENDLLFPLLNTLPETLDAVNLSLGIPLNDLPPTQIFIRLSQLLSDYEQYGKYKAVSLLEFLRSPYLNRLLSADEQKETEFLVEKIFQYGSKLIPRDFILQNLKQKAIIYKSFTSTSTIDETLKSFLSINDFLSTKKLKLTDRISLMKLEKIIKQIIDFQDRTQIITSYKSLVLIFKNLLSHEQLFFEGEPLQGLQVLGLLETRLLDFEHLIITSMNEGILPKGKTHQSLIPFDIKIELGLPTHRNQTSIMAYHFYRLLQRAKNIQLIYNTTSKGLNTGEASRFVLQLQQELKAYQPQTQIKVISYQSSASLTTSTEFIPKTDELMKKLYEKAKSGISPSFLDAYIYDPYEFVKTRLLELEAENELIEGIPVNIFGTIVHDTLKDLYKKHEGQFLTLSDIKEFKQKYKDIATHHFNKQTDSAGQDTGKKHIALHIVKKNVSDIIQMDENLLKNGNQLQIMEIEKKLTSDIRIKNLNVKIKGFVDRIDKLNGQLRIIDYKTGNVDNKDLQYNQYSDNLDILLEDSKKRKIFQVLTYIWLYKQSGFIADGESTIGGIISTRKYRQGLYSIGIGKEKYINDEILNSFEKTLKKLLEEIFDKEINFERKN